ncbi:hypothetical protein BN982_01842 [Halobacillus karajensis]|uniref:Uncharacterized protein n=1 Tax=Halobacillus karajensis TaxID=195088 RepID=A0A024P323_9BACI|nr:hypothetical protein BN982_01842 [Halobacillus karajensis]CDQ22007.1 hypothetical protein BN983_00205 [Halobacillus karajensis]CDQ27848.1 hypothetical protein BN981_02132 [Halobacillus karajensis]
MLAQTEMFVVFVLDEIISQGSSSELTAGKIPKSMIRDDYLESATVTEPE